MAGWCSGSESDDETLNLNLFARKSFAFTGFSAEKENILKNIVTQIGATCDNFAKYIFTTEEHYKSLIDHSHNLYNVTFIRDSVDANRCLSIEQYRFGPKYVQKKEYRDFEPCCNNFHNGEEACIICDPTFKRKVPVMKRRKLKQKSTESADVKNTPKGDCKPTKAKKNIVISKKLNPKNICTIDNCNVGNDPHPKHPKRKTGWEPWECRLILDYIICHKLFFMVKSPSLYKRMFSEGFLRHRTPDSMRVYFNNNILPIIESYDLPKPIMRKLKRIRKSSCPARLMKKKNR